MLSLVLVAGVVFLFSPAPFAGFEVDEGVADLPLPSFVLVSLSVLVLVPVFVVVSSPPEFAVLEVDDVDCVVEEEVENMLLVVVVGFPGLCPLSCTFMLVSVFVLDCPSGSDREPIVFVVIVLWKELSGPLS